MQIGTWKLTPCAYSFYILLTLLVPNISEYKIGHTAYIVEPRFNPGCKDTLDNIIKQLISRDVEGMQFAA